MSVCLSTNLSTNLSVCPSISLSVCLSVYRSAYLSVCPPICLSVRLSVLMYVRCLPVCPPICLSVRLPACRYVRLSLCLFKCLTVRLSVCPSVCLSTSQSVHLSTCPRACLSIILSVHFQSVHRSMDLSACLSLCPNVCLSSCPNVCLSSCLSVHLSVCPSVCLSTCHSVPCLSAHQALCLSACLPVCLCACIPDSLLICLSAGLRDCLTARPSASLPALLPAWLPAWLSVCQGNGSNCNQQTSECLPQSLINNRNSEQSEIRNRLFVSHRAESIIGRLMSGSNLFAPSNKTPKPVAEICDPSGSKDKFIFFKISFLDVPKEVSNYSWICAQEFEIWIWPWQILVAHLKKVRKLLYSGPLVLRNSATCVKLPRKFRNQRFHDIFMTRSWHSITHLRTIRQCRCDIKHPPPPQTRQNYINFLYFS
jgi:hypothetical protein